MQLTRCHDVHYVHGQAMPLILLLCLTGAVTALLIFNTGSAAVHKQRLANAADAGAFSVMTVQARAMNFMAYTNRAMVANQVSVAQGVSLVSWTRYLEQATQTVDALSSFLPPLKPLGSGLHSAATVVNDLVEPLAGAVVTSATVTNQTLSRAQQAMFQAAADRVQPMLEEIVQATNPQFIVNTDFQQTSMDAAKQQWQSFTQRVGKQDWEDMNTRADLIEASQDVFSADRAWDLPLSGGLPGDWFDVRLLKNGQTRLIRERRSGQVNMGWLSKDVLSLSMSIDLPLFDDIEVELPLGWGRASTPEAYHKVCADIARADCTGWFAENDSAETLADAMDGVDGALAAVPGYYDGLQPFRRLTSQGTVNTALQIAVEVSLPMPVESASQSVTGRLSGTVNTALAALSSVSVAEMFYQRPDEPTVTGDDVASAYMPYWTVRLKPVPDRLRESALYSREQRQSNPRRGGKG